MAKDLTTPIPEICADTVKNNIVEYTCKDPLSATLLALMKNDRVSRTQEFQYGGRTMTFSTMSTDSEDTKYDLRERIDSKLVSTVKKVDEVSPRSLVIATVGPSSARGDTPSTSSESLLSSAPPPPSPLTSGSSSPEEETPNRFNRAFNQWSSVISPPIRLPELRRRSILGLDMVPSTPEMSPHDLRNVLNKKRKRSEELISPQPSTSRANPTVKRRRDSGDDDEVFETGAGDNVNNVERRLSSSELSQIVISKKQRLYTPPKRVRVSTPDDDDIPNVQDTLKKENDEDTKKEEKKINIVEPKSSSSSTSSSDTASSSTSPARPTGVVTRKMKQMLYGANNNNQEHLVKMVSPKDAIVKDELLLEDDSSDDDLLIDISSRSIEEDGTDAVDQINDFIEDTGNILPTKFAFPYLLSTNIYFNLTCSVCVMYLPDLSFSWQVISEGRIGIKISDMIINQLLLCTKCYIMILWTRFYLNPPTLTLYHCINDNKILKYVHIASIISMIRVLKIFTIILLYQMIKQNLFYVKCSFTFSYQQKNSDNQGDNFKTYEISVSLAQQRTNVRKYFKLSLDEGTITKSHEDTFNRFTGNETRPSFVKPFLLIC